MKDAVIGCKMPLSPKDPNLWKLGLSPYMEKRKRKNVFAYIIKLRILRWRDYPGLSSWALNAKGNYVRKEEFLPINRR